MKICPPDGGAEEDKTSVLTIEQGQEKQITEGLLNGNCIQIWPPDGGAVEDKTSVLTLEQGEEKQITEGLLNGSCIKIFPLDGGAEEDKALEQGEEKHQKASEEDKTSVMTDEKGEEKPKTSDTTETFNKLWLNTFEEEESWLE